MKFLIRMSFEDLEKIVSPDEIKQCFGREDTAIFTKGIVDLILGKHLKFHIQKADD